MPLQRVNVSGSCTARNGSRTLRACTPVNHGPMETAGRRVKIYTTVSGSSFLPVGPIWISVPMVGQTPQS